LTDWYTNQVREQAYSIWEKEGRLHGNDLAHWFRSEAELRAAWAKRAVVHEKLWAGVAWKLSSAEFFLGQMQRALDQPRGAHAARAEAAGVALSVEWQKPFYANLDAFLAMARSVPDVINWCFGVDRAMREPTWLKPWYHSLSLSEKTRRQDFSNHFRQHFDAFRNLSLTSARNITLHRAGYAPVEAHITGIFGISYIGGPVERVPGTESRPAAPGEDLTDPAVQWAATLTPLPLRPVWGDFEINGKPLYSECQTYLQDARSVVESARRICDQVHGANTVTAPP
jgi:hypothetical protein